MQEEQEYFIRIQDYRPFTMGGSVWRPVKFKVKGVPATISGHKCFTVRRGKKWKVYHADTGFFMSENSKSREYALDKARRDIKRTPDFDKQIRSAGSIESIKEEINASEAWRRLKNQT